MTKTLKDLYKENPKLYREWVAKANKEHKRLACVDDHYFLETPSFTIDYKIQRKAHYPQIGDQLDMLWHAIDTDTLNKDSDFYKEIKKVKDAYPKPEEPEQTTEE